jgi:hypothetical protein
MPLPWADLLLAGTCIGATPLAAQQGKELGLQLVATASDPALVVAGAYGAVRTSARTRVSGAAGAGVSSGDLAVRGEVLGHFLLSPTDRGGPGLYFAGGIAVVEGPVDQAYLVLTLGLEGRPATASGWGVELGVGGGVRVMLGYRWRWFRTSRNP